MFKNLRAEGSSPHTRGALPVCLPPMIRFRIIPAYAGSTAHSRRSTGHRRDHPRIRGEHLARGRRDGLVRGSSPHTRGAPTATRSCTASVRDHPRIRGEHHHLVGADDVRPGSSPHTRGAHLLTSHDIPIAAFIIHQYLIFKVLMLLSNHAIRTRKFQSRCLLAYFRACRYLLALLQPFFG